MPPAKDNKFLYFILFAGAAIILLLFLKAKPKNPSANSQITSTLIALDPQNNSKESGFALVSKTNDNVTIDISTENEPPNTKQPAHLHTGSCQDEGDIVYSLKEVENGQSKTVLNITPGQFRKKLPLVINIHKSDKDYKTDILCAQIISLPD